MEGYRKARSLINLRHVYLRLIYTRDVERVKSLTTGFSANLVGIRLPGGVALDTDISTFLTDARKKNFNPLNARSAKNAVTKRYYSRLAAAFHVGWPIIRSPVLLRFRKTPRDPPLDFNGRV